MWDGTKSPAKMKRTKQEKITRVKRYGRTFDHEGKKAEEHYLKRR